MLSRAESRASRYAELRRKLSRPLYCAAPKAEPADILSRAESRACCYAEPPCEPSPLIRATAIRVHSISRAIPV
jgi:hypothetical protein